MASVTSQLIDEVTAHAQSHSLEEVWEICADGTYFPNNLRKTEKTTWKIKKLKQSHDSPEVPREFQQVKFVTLTPWLPLPPGNNPGTHFC